MQRVDPLVAGERVVDGEEVLRRRLRRRRQLGSRLQARVEVVRVELDVVAEALLAEADVERHDAHVREADLRLREVGGRVEHDRGVLGSEVQLVDPSPGLARASDRADDHVELLVLAQTVDRPCRHQRVELARARRRGQADDRDLGVLLDERDRRLDAVHARQPEVHHDDVRAVLAVGLDGRLSLRDRAGHLDPVLELEQKDQRLPEDVVVLDEQHTDRVCSGLHARDHTATRRRAGAGSAAGRRTGRRARRPDGALGARAGN